MSARIRSRVTAATRPGGRWLVSALAALLVACSGAPRTADQPAAPIAERPLEHDARDIAQAPASPPPEAQAPAAPPTLPAPIVAEPAAREPIELTFVGDVIFGRYREGGFDPIVGPGERPFDEIAEVMRSDLLVGNLETPLVRELPLSSPIASKYRFGASKAMAQHLVEGGFGAMSLANNHSFDQRLPGLLESPAILQELGIVPLGASRSEEPVFRVETIERRGWKIGFLAVTTRRNAPQFPNTPVLPFLSTVDLDATLGPLLAAARADHDLLIVFIHWGDEYADAPARHQRKEAKALIDRGADLVVGHHPHVLQGIERHGGGAIAYSLGNFLFENTNEIPRLTGVLRARFAPGPCLAQLTFHPAYIKRTPSKHPAPATGALGRKVRERMRRLSGELGTTLEERGEDLVLPGTCPS